MKISYNILKTFVTPPAGNTGRSLAETLTMRTVEVESYHDQAGRLAGVVVGLVTAVRPHPNADKLRLAQVGTGKHKLEVVCGGVNLQEGMKVAFANIGTKVRWHGQGDWVTLEQVSIRGVESAGMICAAEELALMDSAAVEHGIMDLSYLTAKPGTPLAEALGLHDIILEVDNKSVTHRPDLWGHLGLARELAAIWQVPFTLPEPPTLAGGAEARLKVTIEAPEHCQRYLGVVVAGLKVAESPAWLKQQLVSLGVRSINNVVDVTNYVMHELGQPLHAFDLARLAGPEIVVRLAKRGEKLVTLDGSERKLEADSLVIADAKHVQAVAGVMGGQASEVGSTTTTIVLESATFDPVSVRLTAGKLGLRTDASMRFEKGLDPALAELALRRAVQLLAEVCPGAHVVSNVADTYPRPLELVKLNLNLPWFWKRLGCEIPRAEVVGILERLGFKITGKGDDLEVKVPSWRATRDITIPEDLIEEVARIYGYDKIPLAMPKFDITPPPVDEAQALRWKIRDLLVGAGWTETLSYSFSRSGQKPEQSLELVNPIDQTRRWLRTSVYDTLHEQFKTARRADEGMSLKFFELGRVFSSQVGDWPSQVTGQDRLPAQPWHLALAAFDQRRGSLSVIRGALKLLEKSLSIKLPDNPSYHKFGGGAVLVEVDLTGIKSGEARTLIPIPKYPSVTRDVSVVVPEGTSWENIEAAVKVSKLIESVEVFDVYEAKRSIAYRLTFRAPDRTLKSEEVDEVMAKITKLLQDKFNATIR